MSIDFEERLRAEMGRVEVHPRPGLAREAHLRHRKSRRRSALAVAATGTAVAVAGTTAGFALTAGSSGSAPMQTTAYVVNRVSSALAATDVIGYSAVRFTGPGEPGTPDPQIDTWEFGRLLRQLAETAAGQPAFDVSSRPKESASVLTQVDYNSRTWTRVTLQPDQELTPAGGNLCTGNFVWQFVGDGKSAADWRQIIESGLKCGAFTIAGRQRVDGVDAIKLTGRKTAADSTIWVDPKTYLPVRLVSRVRVIRVGAGAGSTPTHVTLTADFRWLPPTRANLAKLTAPIPAGFKKAPYPK